MAKYSEFRNYMYENSVSEDFLRCCDYVNCVDSMGGFLFYAGNGRDGGRSFEDFYEGWIKERYLGDKYFRGLVYKMVYEEGYEGMRAGNYFKSYCRYFVEELSGWYGRFKEVYRGEVG